MLHSNLGVNQSSVLSFPVTVPAELETAIREAYIADSIAIEEFARYIRDELSLDDSDIHGMRLVKAVQKLYPTISIDDAEDIVMDMK